MPLGPDIKTNNYSQTIKCNKQTYDVTQKRLQVNKQMGLCEPWEEYKNKPLFTNMKIKQTILICNTKYIQGMNPVGLGAPWCPFIQHLLTRLQTWINWLTALKPINLFMATGARTKNVTLDMALHKPVGWANPYVWFGYVPLTIFNHTRGQVSG